MLMRERKPQPARDLGLCRSRQVVRALAVTWKQECGGASFFRNEAGVHLRQFAKGLRGLAPGSECKLGLHLVLSMGSQASFPISVRLQG